MSNGRASLLRMAAKRVATGRVCLETAPKDFSSTPYAVSQSVWISRPWIVRLMASMSDGNRVRAETKSLGSDIGLCLIQRSTPVIAVLPPQEDHETRDAVEMQTVGCI